MDLRSRMRSLYLGACGFGDMRSRFRATAVIKDTLNEVSFYILNDSVACGRIHQGHERFSDNPQGRQIATNDFKCLEDKLLQMILSVWLLIHSILCPLRR